MGGRYTTTFRQATDAGLDNAALALEELRVGGALAVLREAVEQAMRLDETDARIARGLCGLHEALAKERAAGRRLSDAA